VDAQRFDQIARNVGCSGWTRRGLTRVLAGLAMGPLLGRAVLDSAAKKKKGKKKKKKGNGGVPAPTCIGAPPCASGCKNCGAFCVPDDDEHCCDLADCGGQFSDLFCNATTHRCECEIAGRGRCTGQNRFSCAPCCPGGDFELGERCAGPDSEFVCVSTAVDGCRCPAAMPNPCTAFGKTKCSFDINRDPRVCGSQFCLECGPTGLCCGGLCVSGCGHGTGGSCASGPCHADCSPCEQGSTCCNFGSGSQCYEDMGAICFRP
jgi:hypothetical protein